MHSDRDIELAAQQLEKFRLDGEAYQATQANVLEKYATLMEDFKRLRSDYEEERDSRERYKQLAKGQERNPFVLVLVDGDGMMFDDDFISGGAEGGSLAAQRLNDAIKNSLRSRGLDHCRVMVRVYANLAGLSKAAAKAKLCGFDKRALAPFVASFNRSNDLFDFVDAGELKENADFKIRAMFRQFADNAQCNHIYFAACHDVGYISELTPFRDNKDRITLVRTYAFHHEFAKLGLSVEDLPHIFRNTPLPTEQIAHQNQRLAPNPTPSTPRSQAAEPNTEKICYFFTKGLCKYGKTCKNLHTKPSTTPNDGIHPASASEGKDWRKENRPSVPTYLSDDFMAGAGQHELDFEALLPMEDEIPAQKVAVNQKQQRLDYFVPRPSSEEHAAFTRRVAHSKLCNTFHLKGGCPKGDACEFDHQPITEGLRNDLVLLARHIPCPRRGACRVLACTKGHICQRMDCRHRGGKAPCKLPISVHTMDLKVAEFVPGTKTTAKDTGDGENGGLNGKSYSWEKKGTDSENDELSADSRKEASSAD